MEQSKMLEDIIRLAELKNGRALAKALDIDPAIVTRIRQGKRTFTPLQAKAIEMLTRGRVARTVVRPDIFL